MHAAAAMMAQVALATKEFQTSDTPDAEGRYVKIVGRPSGLMDFVMSALGIDTTTTLEVFEEHVALRASNLSGSMLTIIPITHVSATVTGYFKPLIFLVLGVVTMPTIILPFVFFALYFLNKNLMVLVQSDSSSVAAIAFKRSVIEGVKIGPEHAQEVANIINRLVLKANSAQRALGPG